MCQYLGHKYWFVAIGKCDASKSSREPVENKAVSHPCNTLPIQVNLGQEMGL